MDGGVLKIDTLAEYHNWRKTRRVYSENGVEFPVLNTILVHRSLVQANDYNPNHVAKDKMKLLETSIRENGFCFGIVAILDPDIGKFVIIDGDHRNQISGPDWLNFTYVPLVIRDHPMEKRLAATVQFNKARGVHKIDLNAELVRRMAELGMADIDICKQLGIDADELLRMKRNVKIAEIYKDMQFSKSWDVEERANRPTLAEDCGEVG
jgi:ParB-like chromosome segregation protein Spo0J